MASKSTDAKSVTVAGRQTTLTQFFAPHVSPSQLFNKNLLENCPGASKPKKKPIKRTKADEEVHVDGKRRYQAVIDANQRRIGPQRCKDCGFCGDWDDEEDKKLHDNFHSDFLRRKRNGFAVDLVMEKSYYEDSQILQQESPDLEVVLVLSDSKSSLIKKTRNLLTLLEREIDAVPKRHVTESTDFVLLVVDTHAKKLVGCLVAEKISHEDTSVLPSSEIASTPSENMSIYNAYCGVCLIWVAPSYRRRKLATTLLDTCLRKHYSRCCYQLGAYLHKDNLAFSNPTADGMSFFSWYMRGTTGCRVYNRKCPGITQ